jgi:hypothetical protein
MEFIGLMKFTYLMVPEKVEEQLEKLWIMYQKIVDNQDSDWEEINEARAILYLTGNVYCETIAIGAIERRIHLLRNELTILEFLNVIDSESNRLKELRKDELFKDLEMFYRIIKKYKNKYNEGKYYLDEEKLIKRYNSLNPDDLKVGYKGGFKRT